MSLWRIRLHGATGYPVNSERCRLDVGYTNGVLGDRVAGVVTANATRSARALERSPSAGDNEIDVEQSLNASTCLFHTEWLRDRKRMPSAAAQPGAHFQQRT